jgi:hypothetical protein
MAKEKNTLRAIIDEKAVMAKTRRFDLSFNELLDMYKDNELEITPAFQRIFVWDLTKQSQFIESLLLELPVPPIYVVEAEEGHFVLVDGLQRLSSYLHFRGELNNPTRKINTGDSFALEGCDIAEELNDKKWSELDTALQIRLKRAFVSVQVIRRESDPSLKFHMFKRLNDGGTPISPQQVRNCVIRMVEHGSELMDFVDRMSRVHEYKSCCVDSLTPEQRNQQFDQELVLRFFAMKNRRDLFKHDVGPFISNFAERVSGIASPKQPFNKVREKAIFKKTFQILAASTGEFSFTFPNKSGTELTRGFSAYHFEGVTVGLQKYLDSLNPIDLKQMKRLDAALRKARLSSDFRKVSTGGGRNSTGLLDLRITIIEEAIAAILS